MKIEKYTFGSPIETGAVIAKVSEASKESFPFTTGENEIFCTLDPEVIVYGLGENVRGINKRGWEYVSHCADDPIHVEDKRSLYGAHNFIILSGKRHLGVFLDTPGRVKFDIGYQKTDQLKMIFEEMDFVCYVLEGDTPDQVVEAFRALIGRSYIPPRWAFGYGQSRWSYMTSDEVREVAGKYKEANLPLDSIYLDIDYMERYKDFTIDREKFGDFDALVREMKEQKIHLVPIIDAGVKIEKGYSVYEEGKEKGYFCKDEEGEDFVVGVWPGRCHFPDMLNEEAAKWFADGYRDLVERGIDGFWNDMNEPAIFYSEKRLKKVFAKIDEYKTQNLDVDSYFAFSGLVAGISNNEEDYQSFYHQYHGKKYRHDRVHNLFGYHMTKAAGEMFEQNYPDKRILLFSRASYIGMHRYGGIWQGDNESWWSHLLLNIKMMPSLNMCGFLYTGADLGGFGADTTEDLMLRWLAFGIFTPLMRNHSAMGTRRQELYQFSNIGRFQSILSVRYQLLPYLYSEYMKAALRGKMMFRPLGFIYGEDRIAREVEDQLLLGEEIMIAPVHEQNVSGRIVYFPEEMKVLRFRNGKVYDEGVLKTGHHYIQMPLDEVCIFLRKGHKLPLAKSAQNTEEIDYTDLTIYSFGEETVPYEYYMDDGLTREYDEEKSITLL